MERRLAAILAADVVGYSRLMEADEEANWRPYSRARIPDLSRRRPLSTYREIIEGLVASHHGRVFGSAGDSIIAEFASVVDAVTRAVAIQEGMVERNTDIPDKRANIVKYGGS